MKGRPPLEPRIAELEKRTEALLRMLEQVKERIAMLEGHSTPKPKDVPYVPRFDRWPGN